MWTPQGDPVMGREREHKSCPSEIPLDVTRYFRTVRIDVPLEYLPRADRRSARNALIPLQHMCRMRRR
jgi:hypothetical protein